MTHPLREAIAAVRSLPGWQITRHLDFIPKLCDEAAKVLAESTALQDRFFASNKALATSQQHAKKAEMESIALLAERDRLRDDIVKLRGVFYQTETVLMVVEPRSHKAEYLAALAAVRAALAETEPKAYPPPSRPLGHAVRFSPS